MKVKDDQIIDPQSLPSNFTLPLEGYAAAVEEVCRDERRLAKLKNYARFVVMSVPGVGQYAEADDLLNEAILRTLDERRKWKPEKADFDTYLKGCMRSLANRHAIEAARYAGKKTAVEPSSPEHSTDLLIFDKARARLKGDKTASEVLDLLLASYFPAEIRQILNVKNGVYNAARTRVSRCLRRIVGGVRRKNNLALPDNLFSVHLRAAIPLATKRIKRCNRP
jgi:DNA-directed RNA polymerase specialized sigma24 family protein